MKWNRVTAGKDPLSRAVLDLFKKGDTYFDPVFSLEERAKSRKGKLLFDPDVIERWAART